MRDQDQSEVLTALSRRHFLYSSAIVALSFGLQPIDTCQAKARKSKFTALTSTSNSTSTSTSSATDSQPELLREFGYKQVVLSGGPLREQFDLVMGNLLLMSNDDILKPFRVRNGLPAPGIGLGGWYDENPDYDFKSPTSPGFAPGHCFGQWLSALARAYATTGDAAIREKLLQLIDGYQPTISAKFYDNFRFPAYTYDKILLGLIDAHKHAHVSNAIALLEQTTQAAMPNLPSRATDHGVPTPDKPPRDDSFTWDESYTMPENCFIAWESGAGDQYKELGRRMLLDESFFTPLSENKNVLPGKHAYSHMNALCSAAKAYTSLGSKKHLQAAVNGFRMVQEQSYATGGWGPDESFLEPDSDQLKKSLTKTHHSFETCGAYAHMKLSRYLLCVTHDSAYGDSMERVIYNTVLGVKPLLPDGSAFYYSDYNMRAKKSYYWFKCPCCAGTLPQIVADFGICTYFQDGQGVLVNLYIPSELKWNNKGTDVTLTQTTNYPYASSCKFEVKTCAPTDFDLRLRIPQWSRSAILTVNGKRLANPQVGKFASIARTWQTGDIVELTLPLPVRLEAIDNKNPDTVALLRGPLVLFAVTDDAPVVNRKQLLAVRSISPKNDRFAVEATSGPVDFRPFSEIDAEQYVTYLKVTN